MGEFADLTIDELLDTDEHQQRLLATPEHLWTDFDTEFMKDYDDSYYPLVFSSFPSNPLKLAKRSQRVPKVTKEVSKSKPVESDDPWDRIVSVKEYIQDTGIKIGIYGESGSGKSSAVLSFPRPILYIVPSSTEEVKAFDKEEDVKVVGIDDPDDLLKLINRQQKEKYFKTVALDHATEFQRLIIKKVADVDELPNKLSFGVLSGDQWQEVNGLTIENLDRFLDLSCNVCVLAQERGDNMESDSEIIMPSVSYGLTKGVASWLGPRICNTIQTFVQMGKREVIKKVAGKEVKTSVKEPEYHIRTRKHPVYYCKLRLPKGTVVPHSIHIGEKDSVYDKLKQLGVH